MHVMILGAAGMIGRKLVEKIAREPLILGRPVTRLTMVDAFEPPVPEALRPVSTALTVDLAATGAADRLIESRPELIFHLAAIVSGEAEADFDKGYAVNLDGTRACSMRSASSASRAIMCRAWFSPPRLPSSVHRSPRSFRTNSSPRR